MTIILDYENKNEKTRFHSNKLKIYEIELKYSDIYIQHLYRNYQEIFIYPITILSYSLKIVMRNNSSTLIFALKLRRLVLARNPIFDFQDKYYFFAFLSSYII